MSSNLANVPELREVLPAYVEKAVEMLISRAKSDRRGVFWPLGTHYRQSNTLLFETSLGYGTPGVLLFLSEYYRRSGNAEVLELLGRGASWVAARLKSTPFQHGFYAGTSGVWYLFRRMDASAPGLTPDTWRTDALASLESFNGTNTGSNLATGVAGTLAGSLSTLPTEDLFERGLIANLVKQLVASAKPCTGGVYWDFSPTSIRPPVGFVQGNAGVDYVLACIRQRFGLSYAPVIAGSIGYAGSLIDERSGNWLDQDGPQRLKQLRVQEVEKRIENRTTQSIARSALPEDSISWGTGTLGILISRHALARAYGDLDIGGAAKLDVDRGIRRLSKITAADVSGLDASVQHGVAGLVLALESLRSVSSDRTTLSGIADQALCDLQSRIPVVEEEDLSILSGIAGVAFAQLTSDGERTGAELLDPLSSLINDESGSARPVREQTLDAFFDERLSGIFGGKPVPSCFSSTVLSLENLRIAADAFSAQQQDALLSKSLAHQIGLYQDMDACRFQDLFWSELERKHCFVTRFGEAMDDNLLFGRFTIDASTKLLEVDFDPHSRPPRAVASALIVLRQSTSSGVVEGKLTALQFALLSGFKDGAVVVSVINSVIKRVEAPNVTQRQLADLSLKMVRSFVQAGYLNSQPPTALEAWLTRKRLGGLRKTLFPAVSY